MGIRSDIRSLARAAPGFRPEWLSRLRRMPQPHEALSQLVDHLVSQSADGTVLDAVMEVAELLLASDDAEVVEAIMTGFIEDLMLQTSYPDSSLSADLVREGLPRRCRDAWDHLDALWLRVWQDLPPDTERLTLQAASEVTDAEVRRMVRSTYRVMPDGQLVGVPDVLRYETTFR